MNWTQHSERRCRVNRDVRQVQRENQPRDKRRRRISRYISPQNPISSELSAGVVVETLSRTHHQAREERYSLLQALKELTRRPAHPGLFQDNSSAMGVLFACPHAAEEVRGGMRFRSQTSGLPSSAFPCSSPFGKQASTKIEASRTKSSLPKQDFVRRCMPEAGLVDYQLAAIIYG